MILPDLPNVPPFYRTYVERVKDNDLHANLKDSLRQTLQLVRRIPESKGGHAYAPGKWTIKEVLCHMIDTERIMAYRALRFARNDTKELAGFDETRYAPEANAHGRTVSDIADEMAAVRLTTIFLYRSFTNEMLMRTGTANQTVVSVLNLGFIIPGHEAHHRHILAERYLLFS